MYEKFFKHPLDFVLALISFILLFPLLLVLTVLGAIKMKGNPFFAQPRPGKNERIFKLIKFHENRHISVVVGWVEKRRKALKYKGFHTFRCR